MSTFIGLTALIASVGVPTAIAGAIGGAIITLGASFALSAASAALQGRNRQGAIAGGEGVVSGGGALNSALRSPVIGPIPDQRLALGTVTTSGAVFFRRSAPPNLWRGFLLASHKCGSRAELILNGKAVTLDPNGMPLTAPYYDAFNNIRYLEVSYRDGSDDQEIDPIIARDFPTMPDTFRQRGHATLVLKADYGTSQDVHTDVYGSNNAFNPLVRFEGARYIDLRVPGCRIDDPDTWVFGENASLCLARYLYHPWPNMRLLDPNKIDWDKMTAAADIDDQWRGVMVDGVSTVERNHKCTGVIMSTADPVQTCRELLTACDGLLINSKGKYFVVPGDPRQPIGTLHQDMLAGGFEIHTETPDRDLINIVKTEFVDPTSDYKPQVGPVLRRDDLIELDGKPLETTLTLPFTEGNARAQRLASRKLLETRGSAAGGASSRKAFSGTFNLEARKYRAGDIVNIYFRDFPKANMTIQIMKTQRDETLQKVQIDGVSWSNGRFAWHAPTDQQEFERDQDVLDAEAA